MHRHILQWLALTFRQASGGTWACSVSALQPEVSLARAPTCRQPATLLMRAPPSLPHRSPPFSITVFFLIFVLTASIVLLNVIVAVLLDEFIESVEDEKRQHLAEHEAEHAQKRIKVRCCVC